MAQPPDKPPSTGSGAFTSPLATPGSGAFASPAAARAKELELARMGIRKGLVTGIHVVEAALVQAFQGWRRPLPEVLVERDFMTPVARAQLEQLQARGTRVFEPDELEPALPEETGPDPLLGTVVFGVRLDARVERRRFTTSYVGRRANDPDPVVLKLIETTALRGGIWLDFLETVRAVVAVKSPHVVPVLDAGRAEGAFAIVLRYLEGIDLSALLARVRRVKLAEAVRIGLDAAKGLRDLHKAGLVHRDVKPSAIRLTKRGDVLVQEAGIVFEPPSARRLHGPGVYGTPHTMAPEVARGSLADAKSDVYSLGCVIYEMVTGSPPFEGFGFADLKEQHVAVEPLPPHAHQLDVPAPVGEALLRMLAKAKDRRPGSDETVALLEKLHRDLPKTTGFTRPLPPPAD